MPTVIMPEDDSISILKKCIADKIEEFCNVDFQTFFHPSNSTPLILSTKSNIDDIYFFSDHLKYQDEIFNYTEFCSIHYKMDSHNANFRTQRNALFTIIFLNTKKYKVKPIPFAKSGFSEDESKLISFVYHMVSNATFDNRIKFKIACLKRANYFQYEDYRFYNTGEVRDTQDKIIANLKNEGENNRISFGSLYKGFGTRSSNPFEFLILSDTPRFKILGFEFGIKLKIMTIIDHDVFTALIQYFIKNGKYPDLDTSAFGI